LSCSLLKYPTGCGVGPWSWVSIPRVASSPLFHRHIAGSSLGWANSMPGLFGVTT
jgi:hypothetical protein